MESYDILTAALDYASRGWYIFPVRGKLPDLTSVAHWSRESSCDPAQIAAWYAGRSGLGIGLDLARSRLAVVDGDHLERLNIPREILTGPAFRGNPARQSWLFGVNGHPVRQASYPWGETKAAGGYVVLPPSPHPDGFTYEWLDDDTDIPDVPALLLAYLTVAAAKPGERNDVLNKVAYSLGDDTNLARETLLAAARVAGLPDHEARATIRSGLKAGAAPDDGIDGITLLTSTELDTKTFPPVRYHVPGILTCGGITLLAGPPKSGKSMLAIALAYAIARDGVALGRARVAHAGAVLVVSLDDQSESRAQRRLRKVADGGGMTDALALCLSPIGRGAAAVDRLMACLRANPAVRLVVIDTVEHLRPDRASSDTSYTADVRFLAELRRVTDAHPDVSLLCLAHTRKPAGGTEDDPISAVSGTHGVTGGADHLLVLTGTRGTSFRVLDVVSRDDEDSRVVLTFGQTGWRIVDEDPDDPTLRMTPDDADVYRALLAYGSDGATAVDLEPECEHVTKIGNRLANLARKGHVRRAGRGKYVVS